MTLVKWMYSGIADSWFHVFRSLLRHQNLPVDTFKSATCTTGPLVFICLMHVVVKITTAGQRHLSVERRSWCSPGSRECSWKHFLQLMYSIISSTLITCSSSKSSNAHDLLHSDHSLKHLLGTRQHSGEPREEHVEFGWGTGGSTDRVTIAAWVKLQKCPKGHDDNSAPLEP